jgi:hypothetical protein
MPKDPLAVQINDGVLLVTEVPSEFDETCTIYFPAFHKWNVYVKTMYPATLSGRSFEK